MTLDALQADALREVINIGYGRAAAALAEMTGERVLLDAPTVTLLEVGEMGPELNKLFASEIACVSQAFAGPISGNAVLLLDDRSASMLAKMVTHADHPELKEADAVTEVGNIVLSACLGVFGNLLHMQIGFTLPNLRVAHVDNLFRSAIVNGEQLSHALLVSTRFSIKSSNVKGYLGIVLGVGSTERLFEAIENWADS